MRKDDVDLVLREIATKRILEAIAAVRDSGITERSLDEQGGYANRQRNLKEYIQTAVARLSDAAEQLEQEGDLNKHLSAVRELVSSADILLEAAQDLLVCQNGNYTAANSLAEPRELIDTADSALLSIQEVGAQYG